MLFLTKGQPERPPNTITIAQAKKEVNEKEALEKDFCILYKYSIVILYKIPYCKMKKLVIYYSQKG